jgi:hypothetical protein
MNKSKKQKTSSAQPALPDTPCDQCVNGNVNYCLGRDGKPIAKRDGWTDPPPEQVDMVNWWTWISCKKNFGLPANCYVNSCPLFKQR